MNDLPEKAYNIGYMQGRRIAGIAFQEIEIAPESIQWELNRLINHPIEYVKDIPPSEMVGGWAGDMSPEDLAVDLGVHDPKPWVEDYMDGYGDGFISDMRLLCEEEGEQ